MADEEKPDTPAPDTPAETPAAETPAAETPAAETPETLAEGHAVPSEEAAEIASVAEDAPLEAIQEAAESKAEEQSAKAEEESSSTPEAEEQPAQELKAEESTEEEHPGEEPPAEAPTAEEQGSEGAEDEESEEPTPRVKPSVPGAHLEVDIVPEGADPLGRSEGYGDPYAVEDDETQTEQGGGEEDEKVLTEPISTAAIDLASGARYRATGKRKTAIARVTLRPGSGTYLVNGRALEEHFPRLTLQRNIRQPLETVGYQDRMDVVARLHGGGISAQAGALRHGVSRALLEADPNLRGELKRRGFLTRDSRAKERKKAGLKKARKRPQFSKR